MEYATENNLEFVHPFTDEEVIAGQGTIALEMLEEQKGLDAVIVPCWWWWVDIWNCYRIKAVEPGIFNKLGWGGEAIPGLGEGLRLADWKRKVLFLTYWKTEAHSSKPRRRLVQGTN